MTAGGVGFSRLSRIAARIRIAVVDECAQQVRGWARQHFLKQDAVFFNVLVYSRCRAFRFPSARSDELIYLLEGNMAKKAKKAKKAKSAVKKTARKTRRVKKKK